jgi:hypothetical protein
MNNASMLYERVIIRVHSKERGWGFAGGWTKHGEAQYFYIDFEHGRMYYKEPWIEISIEDVPREVLNVWNKT